MLPRQVVLTVLRRFRLRGRDQAVNGKQQPRRASSPLPIPPSSHPALPPSIPFPRRCRSDGQRRYSRGEVKKKKVFPTFSAFAESRLRSTRDNEQQRWRRCTYVVRPSVRPLRTSVASSLRNRATLLVTSAPRSCRSVSLPLVLLQPPSLLYSPPHGRSVSLFSVPFSLSGSRCVRPSTNRRARRERESITSTETFWKFCRIAATCVRMVRTCVSRTIVRKGTSLCRFCQSRRRHRERSHAAVRALRCAPRLCPSAHYSARTQPRQVDPRAPRVLLAFLDFSPRRSSRSAGGVATERGRTSFRAGRARFRARLVSPCRKYH